MTKVLYIEDNDDNVYMLKMRLELLGDFEVLAAEDSQKGCEIAATEQPDIIGIGDGSWGQLGEASNRLDLVGRNPNRVRLVEGNDPLWKGVGRAPVQDQWWRFGRWNLAGISHHLNPGALARHFADVLGQ